MQPISFVAQVSTFVSQVVVRQKAAALPAPKRTESPSDTVVRTRMGSANTTGKLLREEALGLRKRTLVQAMHGRARHFQKLEILDGGAQPLDAPRVFCHRIV